MPDFHGIILAYSASPELGELVRTRTASSLPFCGRYRLIDFALSSMENAGIHDVGVIMQRDYQSLLDHLGSGKDWDMSRRHGGLRMLPPFGLPEYHTGEYNGTHIAVIFAPESTWLLMAAPKSRLAARYPCIITMFFCGISRM